MVMEIYRVKRWFSGWRVAMLAGAAMLAAPVLAQIAEPDAFTRAAMEKRRDAEATLASAMARIGSDRTDAAALIDAGRASLTLDNPQAALGFLSRAAQLRSEDGTVAALTGAAMVQLERPAEAMEHFERAARLGAAERLYLSDRGLAHDLLGRQDAAQRDYETALAQTNDGETQRRYALSLGISGQVDRAVQVLTPQLRSQDRAAWRTRAMVLAIAGRQAEAQEIVRATMPGPIANNITPFLARLPGMTPAQQAAAAHFGALPGGTLPGGPRPTTPLPRPAAIAAAPVQPAPPPAVPRPAPTTPAAAAPKAAPAAATRPTPIPLPPSTVAQPTAAATTPTTPASGAAKAPTTPASGATTTPATPASGATTAPATVTASTADSGLPRATPRTVTLPVVQSDRPFAAPPSSAAALPGAAPAPAPAVRADLGAIIAALEIPADELRGTEGALDAAALERIKSEQRSAALAAAEEKKREVAAARVKAEADAKAKAEADRKKANPARQWVQVATGANAGALAGDFGRLARKYPAEFKGQKAATAEWGRTRRLLVGPFPNARAAGTWLAALKKAGGDGFPWSSDAGEEVNPVR